MASCCSVRVRLPDNRSAGDSISATARQRKGLAQAGFDSDLGLGLAVTLLLLSFVVIPDALRAGAAGSLFTPGLSIGGLLGILLGGAWNYAWPAGPLGACAVVGSAAFLASSMTCRLRRSF
jgi:H+/Cl- antiporter ClcA